MEDPAETVQQRGTRIDGRRRRYEHRRDELLQAAAAHALEHGLTNLTLRRIAESVGVSHATLVHHFGTRDRLVAEIVDTVLTRSFTAPEVIRPPAGEHPLRALWRHGTGERGLRSLRLFFAITGQSLHGEAALADAVHRSLSERTGLVAAGLQQAGCPERDALPLATLVLSAMRGLVLDLLVTGERARVDAAFNALVADVDRRAASWTRPAGAEPDAGGNTQGG
ncbi:TetR/AcrR family transcriptional regulator [Kineococcus xinjiangensis]|uniref:TetR/AcrR family transcriptional regulator n=1 Tax=Kineococcus xinjiangensis TaxID=512762 RepID=UPI001304C8EC|nr:TetR/AcrR family transcriptional regulator [Kineococcus xinjiangensis]